MTKKEQKHVSKKQKPTYSTVNFNSTSLQVVVLNLDRLKWNFLQLHNSHFVKCEISRNLMLEVKRAINLLWNFSMILETLNRPSLGSLAQNWALASTSVAKPSKTFSTKKKASNRNINLAQKP